MEHQIEMQQQNGLTLEALNSPEPLSEHDSAELAEVLSKPVTVPAHVILILTKVSIIAAEAIDEEGLIYEGLEEAGLASMVKASEQDREDLGDDCPDQMPTATADVYNAINWGNAILNSLFPHEYQSHNEDDCDGD